MKLRIRILKAGAWTVGSYSIEIVSRLASNLILAHLLFPEAFGLVAASSSIIVGLALFSDFGIRAVVIQSPRGGTPSFLRSAWVFQVSRGVVLWLFLFTICAIIDMPAVRELFPSGSAFANSLFPEFTVVLGFGLVLSGLESTALLLHVRNLELRPLMVVDLTAKLITLPVMIAAAFALKNAWPLAIGGLTGGVVRLVLSHTVVSGPRMGWSWNLVHFREILGFGKWVTVSSIASFVGSQSDIFLLGLLLPGSALGIYSIARALISNVEGLLERINSNLTLSVLGEVLRVNPSELKNRYYQFRLPIEAVAAAGGGLVFATSSQIIGLMYDARYSSAGPMLQILAIGLSLYPFQLIRSAFTAIGETYTVAVVSWIQAASLSLFLIMGYLTDGTLGAVIGIAASRIVPSVVFLVLAHKRDWIGIWNELRGFPIFGGGFLLGRVILALGELFAPESMQHFLR
jgi:O-antigen/teichoic acid export membrane protein